VQSRQEADCSHSFESLEPSNFTSPPFITDEEIGGHFLCLNESLSFALVQLVHEQADICHISRRAS
jgi:hypothetical protein